jgi:hypothetical protein
LPHVWRKVWKNRALLAYSPNCCNRKKTPNNGCLIDLLGYSVFVTRILRGDGYRLA